MADSEERTTTREKKANVSPLSVITSSDSTNSTPSDTTFPSSPYSSITSTTARTPSKFSLQIKEPGSRRGRSQSAPEYSPRINSPDIYSNPLSVLGEIPSQYLSHSKSSGTIHTLTNSSPTAPATTHSVPSNPMSPILKMDALSLQQNPTNIDSLDDVLENNKKWADQLKEDHPGIFEKLAQAQTPEILWIGCSDSRVPAENITGLGPGDLFVHRNIANVVINTDLSLLSVLQYAIDVLQVKHVVVCGHYQCGGCLAAMSNKQFGLIDNWLRNIKDIYQNNQTRLDNIESPTERGEILVELNVAKSVQNICHTSIIQNAWERGQQVSIHGWVYRLSTGYIEDLQLCINKKDEVEKIFTYVTNTSLSQNQCGRRASHTVKSPIS